MTEATGSLLTLPCSSQLLARMVVDLADAFSADNRLGIKCGISFWQSEDYTWKNRESVATAHDLRTTYEAVWRNSRIELLANHTNRFLTKIRVADNSYGYFHNWIYDKTLIEAILKGQQTILPIRRQYYLESWSESAGTSYFEDWIAFRNAGLATAVNTLEDMYRLGRLPE